MRILEGVVVSAKMKNTLVVEVVKQKRHPLFGKIMKSTKRYKVHVDNDNIKTGDNIQIGESKPISKDKHFKFIKKL